MNFIEKTQNSTKSDKSCSIKLMQRDQISNGQICLSMDTQSIAQIISDQMMKEVHRSLKSSK